MRFATSGTIIDTRMSGATRDRGLPQSDRPRKARLRSHQRGRQRAGRRRVWRILLLLAPPGVLAQNGFPPAFRETQRHLDFFERGDNGIVGDVTGALQVSQPGSFRSQSLSRRHHLPIGFSQSCELMKHSRRP
jgi:hypothetical protein